MLNSIHFPVSFLNVADLMSRWQCGIHTLQALAEEEKIRFYIRPIALELALESVVDNMRDRILKLISAGPLCRYDVYRIFKNPTGQIPIRQFGKTDIKELASPAPEITAELCDLIIPLYLVESFECANSNSDAQPANEIRPLSPDFSCFILRGREYCFGEMQAKIIKRLWHAREEGNPWMYGKRILSDVGSGSERIQSVFNHNSDWRQIILSDNNGKYKLNLPPKEKQLVLF